MLVDNIIIKILISEQLSQQQKQDLLDAYEDGNFKSKYREFARVYHPDKNPDPTAKISFQDLGNIFNILGKVDDGLMSFAQAEEIILAQEEQQQQQQQHSMQELAAGAQNIVKIQNAKEFLKAYISLCNMARNVSPPIRNADRRISSAQSAAAEFLKTVDWLMAPIDSRTKEAWFQQMLDAGFFDTNAAPGSGRMSYNLISSLDTGVDMMGHFYNLVVNLGYEIGYYKQPEEEDEIGNMFDDIKNMKDFFNTYLEELKYYPDYSQSEKKLLKKNFIWLLNTWYADVRENEFDDRYDRELEENLKYISNLGAENENVRKAFKRLYNIAKRNRKKRKRNNARIWDRRR